MSITGIRSFLGARSSESAPVATSHSDSSENSDSETEEPKQPSPPKKHCVSSTSSHSSTSSTTSTSSSTVTKTATSGKRRYNKKWEETFPLLEYDEDYRGAFCKFCRRRGKSLQRTREAWITKPFNNWKKATERMRAHSQSDVHIQSCHAELAATRAMKEGSIVRQLQHTRERQRMKNRTAVKALLHCTHFLTINQIAHTTNFDRLVELVVQCGGEDLERFIETASKNYTYTSKDAVVQSVSGLKNLFLSVSIRHPSTAYWQMNPLILQR